MLVNRNDDNGERIEHLLSPVAEIALPVETRFGSYPKALRRNLFYEDKHAGQILELHATKFDCYVATFTRLGSTLTPGPIVLASVTLRK